MGFRGGKLAMADIAVGELALLRSYMFFGSVHAMRSLGRCVMASKSLPIWLTRMPNYFDGPRPASRICLDRGPKLSERHVFTLTGV